jgi:uncharacterized protein (DUF362 family)
VFAAGFIPRWVCLYTIIIGKNITHEWNESENMIKQPDNTGRRQFLRNAVTAAGLAAVTGTSSLRWVQGASLEPGCVAVTSGEDRADNIFRALEFVKEEIRDAIGGRRVIIKPNNVSVTRQLAATHVESIEGTLEFLKSIGINKAVIAESPAPGTAMQGYDNFGYLALQKKYDIEFMDLDDQGFETVYLFDQKSFQPIPIRLSDVLLDRQKNFVISSAVMKTHDRVVSTLSLKNIVFAATLKDKGYTWDEKRKPGTSSDKPKAHGSGYRATNFNIFTMASRLHPDLAVIDGYQGMEGNGPVGGSPVEHRVAVASMDWLAADRVSLELMGIDFSKVGYLNYCARAGYGQSDLEKIRILGETIADHRKPYRLHDKVERQLIWQKPAVVG